MSATNYARSSSGDLRHHRTSAALRAAVAGGRLTVGGIEMPIWPSWVAFVVAGGLAWLGFRASRT